MNKIWRNINPQKAKVTNSKNKMRLTNYGI